jgi:hypothetical protein
VDESLTPLVPPNKLRTLEPATVASLTAASNFPVEEEILIVVGPNPIDDVSATR